MDDDDISAHQIIWGFFGSILLIEFRFKRRKAKFRENILFPQGLLDLSEKELFFSDLNVAN